MTDPTPEPYWPPHAARRHVQEPAPDESIDPGAWPEDAIHGNRRGTDGRYLCCRHCADDAVHDVEPDGHDGPCSMCDDRGALLRERAERAESNARGKQAVIEAQRATLDRVRAHVRPAGADTSWKRAVRAILDAPQPCPTCSGPIRETVGMVCQTCGTDYAAPEAGGDDE